MADYIDNFAVKVSADTKDLTKEIKKLRRSFKDLFNTKANNQELDKFAKELKDIGKMPYNPFRDWNSELIKTERILKGVGAKTLRQHIKEYKSIAKEFRSMGLDARAEEYEGLAKQAKSHRKKGYKYSPDPKTASEDFMLAKYGTKWKYAEAYFENKKIADAQRTAYKAKFGTLKDARAKYNELVKAGTKPDKELEDYVKGYYKKPITDKTNPSVPQTAEEKKKFSEMKKEYDAFKKRQEEALKGNNEKGGGKGFLGRIGTGIWNGIKAGVKMLWRIFTRYLGYQLIKNLFGGIEQGMQNLYQWSKYNKKEW